MNVVELTIENVSRFVEEANALIGAGHPEWQKFVEGTKFVATPTILDPDDPAYLDEQLRFWRIASGRKSYRTLECEANNNLDGVTSIRQFYPFVSGNPVEIGRYFHGVANIVESIGAKPPGRVAEFGVGWGHTVRLLAAAGYKVSAIDIEKRFLNFTDGFALPGATHVEAINASFTEASFPANSLDAAIFFESFHHCLEFRTLLKNLHGFLKPGGRIIFEAESFYDDWYDIPWGLRLDGHSIWAIRNFGWMELGFRKTYIGRILDRLGFSLSWSSLGAAGAYGERLIAIRA